MARRTVLPPGIFGGPEMERRLLDVYLNAQARRPASEHATIFGKWPPAEVGQLVKLIRGLFGDKGLIECGQDDPGLMLCGYFVDGPGVAPIGTERRRVFPFKGRTLAEVEEQIRTWRANS